MNFVAPKDSSKVSMAELQRLMRDPDFPESQLRPYFLAYPEASGPFSPAIVPNPDRVDVTAPCDELEAAPMMGWVNSLSRQRRQNRFKQRRAAGDKSPVFVSEGDSWFQFPVLLDDVIDQLDTDFNIWSVDSAGDTLQNMVRDQPEYIDALQEQAETAQAFLFSGAGNDFLGADDTNRSVLSQILKSYKAGKPAGWYIETNAFADKLRFVEDCYRQVLSTVEAKWPKLPVICHGYDYAIPGNGPGDTRRPIYAAQDKWLARPMRDDLGIVDFKLQRSIIRLLIDKLNECIAGLCGGNRTGGVFKNAWQVDARDTLATLGQWADELHPTSDGFAQVASKFRAVVAKAIPGLEAELVSQRATPAMAYEAVALDGERAGRRPVAAPVYVCEASGESDEAQPARLEAAAVKPRVDRVEATTHKSSRNGTDIDHIVVHYTTSRNIEGSISHFKNGTPRTSAHYIVGRDGVLVEIVPDRDCAWHAGKSEMNARSIGIEHVAAAGDAITAAQTTTSIALIGWLMQEYGIPLDNVIPHVCVKPTSCCGDLFKDFGGGAGKPCNVQKPALHRWLRANGIGTTTEAIAPDIDLQPFPEAAPVGRRLAMAKIIVDFEARRDAAGRLKVYMLPEGDGGGRYEVAGINEKYHKTECDELVRLIQSGRHAEAEARAREFIAGFTDAAARWCRNGAIEFYLRDCIFNRGAGGAGRILQRALGATVDGNVGPQTRAALALAEANPRELLDGLRKAREWYERTYAHRDETSHFWAGLVNRWNHAKASALQFIDAVDETEALESASSPRAPTVLLQSVMGSSSSVMRARMDLAPELTVDVGEGIEFINSQHSTRSFGDIGQDSPVDDPEKMLKGWRALKNGLQPEENLEIAVERDTSLPAVFLQVMAEHRRVVGRISASGKNYKDEMGRWAGTGFLVDKNILLTNHHVLNSADVARGASIDFEYEVSISDLIAGKVEPSAPLGKRVYRFNPDRLFLTSPARGGGLDFTFVWIETADEGPTPPIVMRRTNFAISKGEQAFVIHHPQGHGKRVSIDDVDVLDINATVVRYTSDTMPGSSGAPVFDRQGRLFALHHASSPGSFSRPDGRPVSVLNEGIKLAAIVGDLETRGPSEKAFADLVLKSVQGSDTMSGFFGNLGRASRIPATASSVEAVVDSYRGSEADIDVGFWNIEWLANRYTDRTKLREAAALITDLGLDVWGLEEVSPPAVEALVQEIDRNFGEKYDFALSEPDASKGKQSTAVIWKTKTVTGTKEAWPDEIESYWKLRSTDNLSGLEAVEGEIFNRYPGLFRFTAKGSKPPFDFYVVPLHLKAMAEGSKRRQLASRLLARAVRLMTEKYRKDADWVLGGDFNAELATNDFNQLLDANMKPMSASDEQAGAFTYLKSPRSLIDHIFLSPNLVRHTQGDAYFIVAKDKSIKNYVAKLSDHAPVLVRLSLGMASEAVRPAANLDAEIDDLLRPPAEARGRTARRAGGAAHG
jgi:endonuclease/exonuclease/phosphatase family metal-dependent hydrolase